MVPIEVFLCFPECVARVPVSLWGSGGEAVFAKICVCGRNRSQPPATVRNRLRVRRKALHCGECCRKGSPKCVKFTCGLAVLLAFAEEVSV